MRIAQCTDSFLPIENGVGRISYEYACALSARGHECYVITPMENGFYRGRYPFEIVDFFSLPRKGEAQYRTGMAALDMHYLARADSIPFDVVHAHSPGAAGMEAARIAERLRIPLVGTFHPSYLNDLLASESDDRQAALPAHFLFDYFSRCDEIWTVSEAAKELLRLQGFTCDIEVFENGTETGGVDCGDLDRVRDAFHLLDVPILLFVGRLDRAGNLLRMLDAAALLKKDGVSFQLVFAGQGSEEQAAKARALALSLTDRVRFLGHISDESLLSGLYAAATLCLFPSQTISSGLVIREAAAHGTPSLVVAGSAVSAYVSDNDNGLCCGDAAESMAGTIKQFLSDPERIERISRRARQTLPVSWESVIDRVEERYAVLSAMDKAALRRKRGFFRKELGRIDQTLEKRTMELMLKFLKQDHQHLYAYPHRSGKPALPKPVCAPAPLLRATPESQGVDARRLTTLINAIQTDAEADAQCVMILRNGRVIAEGSWAPYDARLPHQLYSLSKSITATAVGMLADEGRLDIDERLADIFYDKVPPDQTHPSHRFTVRNLLNMSTGSLFNEVGTALGADWEKEFLSAGVKFPAGSSFDYNSMNTYMLAAVVRRKTGQTLTQYLRPRLYEPLRIEQYDWETCPNGTEKGGWGLSLSAESVAKIGQLYLNRGLWNVDGTQKRLLSEKWISEATRPQIDTPSGEITFGYGHQMWMTSHPGAFLFNGAFGQYMLALPDKNALVVLFSGTARLFANGGVMDYVDAAFADVSPDPLPENPSADEALRITLSTLTVRNRSVYYDPIRTELPFAFACERLHGRVYSFDRNTAGLMPSILGNVTNNYSTGIERAAFLREPDGTLRMELSEGACLHRVALAGRDYTEGEIEQRGDAYAIRANVQTELVKTGEWMLHVNVHFIETPFTRILHFLFRDDAVTLILDECPSLKDASAMLMELAGLSRAQVFRTLMPLLKRESLQNTLRTFTTATLQGRL